MANLYVFYDKRSPRKDGSGTLKMALHHKGQTHYQSLDIHIKREEWDSERCRVVSRPDMKFHNIFLRKRLADAEETLQRIELRKDYQKLTCKDILTMIMRGTDTADTPEESDYLLPVYNEYITVCRKPTTAALYRSSLKNIKEFEPEIDSLRFKDINVAWLRRYQQWLATEKRMETNGANVYLRNLRTVFNYAIQNELTSARYPFRDIDMSTTEPDKRLVPYEKFLDWATLPMPDQRNFYRDMFMLSFYLCGIRPIDLLHVKKDQIEDGRLVYFPEKLNGRTKLSIKIEPEAWEIIRRYEGEKYMLNILETRTDYKEFCKHWNIALRCIGKDVDSPRVGRGGYHYIKKKHYGVIPYITAYYARTCWASYAYNVVELSMDIISQALGHKNGLRVTNFYVKRDSAKVDEANRKLIDRVTKDMEEFALNRQREAENQETQQSA